MPTTRARTPAQPTTIPTLTPVGNASELELGDIDGGGTDGGATDSGATDGGDDKSSDGETGEGSGLGDGGGACGILAGMLGDNGAKAMEKNGKDPFSVPALASLFGGN